MKRKKMFVITFIILSLTLMGDLYSQQNYRLRTPDYRVEITEDGFHSIRIRNYYSYAVPGYPDLPSRIFRAALPPDVDPDSINLSYSIKKTEYVGEFNIKEMPAMRTWIDGQYVTGNKAEVYNSDDFYPRDCVEYAGFSQMRKWRIAAFKFIPFQYNPVTQQLRLVSEVEVTIDYNLGCNSGAIENELNDSVMDKRAQNILMNYQESLGWYESTGAPAPSVTYDYVIITTNSIESSSTKLADFVTYLGNIGFSPLVITQDEYGGLTGQAPNGTAEKIRKWLIDNYISYGINYVLLIGNPDPDDPSSGSDSVGDVPMKMCWPRRTEVSDRESPTDYFYADLTGNWDLDGDQYYGEYNDDTGTGGVDFDNEVYVGRIPVYFGVSNLDSVLTKTIAYGSSTNVSWRKNVLLPMSYSDSLTDGAYLSEAMISNYLSVAGYSAWTMYMQGSVCAAANSGFSSHQELLSGATQTRWAANDYGMVWWWGHGSSTSASLGYSGCGWGTIMNSTGASSLDDTHPSFVYQCSCNNGYPENTNNLGTALLYNGAIGTVSASRVSWYAITSWHTFLKYYCDNASIGYYYGYELASAEKNAGVALYDVKADMGANRYSYWGGCHIMNLYDFNLYGDPSAAIACRTFVSASPDFNGDGRADIVWRYYGTGGYNAVWLRGTAAPAASVTGISPEKFKNNPGVGDMGNPKPIEEKGEVAAKVDNGMSIPIQELRELGIKDGFEEYHIAKVDQSKPLIDPFDFYMRKSKPGEPVSRIMASTVSDPRDDPEAVELPAAVNLDWKLCGTGDFNGDDKVDLLWRNLSDGRNLVWYLDGVTLTGTEFLPSAVNLDWTLCGTGDFNNDDKMDLVWRNISDGRNLVWYLDGVTLTGTGWLPTAVNLDWALCGSGDFNSDGKVDLVWRNMSDGRNLVWYLVGVTLTGAEFLPSAVNMDWTLCGSGDFNNDGKVDLLWQNLSSGGNLIWYLDGVTLTGTESLTTVTNTTWRIEN